MHDPQQWSRFLGHDSKGPGELTINAVCVLKHGAQSEEGQMKKIFRFGHGWISSSRLHLKANKSSPFRECAQEFLQMDSELVKGFLHKAKKEK